MVLMRFGPDVSRFYHKLFATNDSLAREKLNAGQSHDLHFFLQHVSLIYVLTGLLTKDF